MYDYQETESVHNAGTPVHMIDKHGAGSTPLNGRRLDQVSCPYIIEIHQKDKHQPYFMGAFRLMAAEIPDKAEKRTWHQADSCQRNMKPHLIGRPGPKSHQKGTAGPQNHGAQHSDKITNQP